MTIRERVAQALRATDGDRPDPGQLFDHLAATAITALLEAAAEEGWHMRRDEATEEMAHAANGFSYVSEYTMRQDKELIDKYRAVMEAAPPFELDK